MLKKAIHLGMIHCCVQRMDTQESPHLRQDFTHEIHSLIHDNVFEEAYSRKGYG